MITEPFSRRSAVLLLTALLALSPRVQALDDTGHQVVAAIAYERLSPAAKLRVDNLFPPDPKTKASVIFVPAHRAPTKDDEYPKTYYTAITVANWMDDLRDNSYDSPTKDWHFVDRPFYDGIPDPQKLLPSPNAQEKLIGMIATLKQVRDFNPKESTLYDNPRTKKRTQAAYAVAVITHLIGDVHQPLHCCTRCTQTNPEGDHGGGFFKLDEQSRNLHEYWDASGGLFDGMKLGRDVDEASKQQLNDFVGRVKQRWDPAKHPGWQNSNPQAWVEASYQLATKEVYAGVVEKQVPSDAYREKTRQLAAEQIMLAGYRLAELLNLAFDPPAN